MADAGFGDAAGRGAYLATFHAAQAFIFDRTGKPSKSHKGVRAQFAKLARDEPGIDEELRRFLPRAYDVKSLADYELGPDASIPLDRATAAIDKAGRFIDCVATLLSDGAQPR